MNKLKLLARQSTCLVVPKQLARLSLPFVPKQATRAITTGHLGRRYTPLVEVIQGGSNDPRLNEIYRLRHQVLYGQTKNSLFTPDHDQVFPGENGFEIRDALDDEESTMHYAVRRETDGKLVSSIRAVDGNKAQLEMEKFGWYNVEEPIREAGFSEWCRLICDKSARGTTAVPLLYLQSARQLQDSGIDNVVFMVDTRAKKLLSYYKKWTICEQISETAVRCDEFEKGRESYVMNMPMGSTGSFQRAKFYSTVEVPCIAAIALMPSYNKQPEGGDTMLA